MRPSLAVIIVKRLIDLAFGLFGTTVFVLTFPFFALLIRWDSKGSILYSQERIGINKRLRKKTAKGEDNNPLRLENIGGQPFTIYKYRSMRTDAEVAGPQFSSKAQDPRVTQVGWWLRALHLDELPQFWNILKGEMSFIGPRPERAHFTREFHRTIPHYESRTLYTKPGLTGLAQITVGYDDSLESVVRKSYYDFSYRAAQCSFRSWLKLEIWIYWNTIFYLLKPLKKEGDLRELDSLERAKSLNFVSRAEDKQDMPRTSAMLRLHDQAHPQIISAKTAAEAEEQLAFLDGQVSPDLEVCYTPSDKFDLEELGQLIELVHRVKESGGKVTIRGSSPKLRRMLQEIHLDKLVEVKRTPNHVKNFLTIDVECWFHAFNLMEKVPPSTWHTLEPRLIPTMERILALLSAHNTKATFFILGWVADRMPEVVRMIHQGGHEIGTHGYYHNLITHMTPDKFEDDLLKSIDAISKHTTQTIIGHRASNFTIVESTLWALEIMAKHGLRYDSSIFPIQRDRYGIPDYPNRLPHNIHLASGKEIREFPMSTLGVGKKFMPMSGGGYLRLFPHQVTEMFIDNKNQKSEPAMVYFHPWELDLDQQRLNVGLLKSFQHYVNLHTTEWKLNRLLEKFAFTSIRDAMENRRMQVLLKRNPVYINDDGIGRNSDKPEAVLEGKEKDSETPSLRPAARQQADMGGLDLAWRPN